jgi:hypothetical protein
LLHADDHVHSGVIFTPVRGLFPPEMAMKNVSSE